MEKRRNAIRVGRLIRWVGMLISSGLFIGLVARQDFGALARHLREIPLWTVPLILALYYGGMICNAARWYVLLRTQKLAIAFVPVIKIVFAGAFISNFLPSTIGGDTVRVIGIKKWANNNWIVSTSSVFVDRLLNVLAMFANIPLSLMTFGPGLVQYFQGSWAAPASASASFFYARFKNSNWLRIRFWAPLKSALSLWWNQPQYLVLAFFISWISIFVVFLAVWWVARLLGIQVALYQVIGINVITYLLTLAPVSFNGYGVREIAMTSLYIQMGASLEQASALALITRFFMVIETLPGALWLSGVFPGALPTKSVEEQQELL